MSLTAQLIVIFLLILANGILSGSEMAVVSSRRSRLETEAEQGDRKSKSVLDLVEHPTLFLSAIQIGITLVGTLAGALGGATVAELLAPFIAQAPVAIVSRHAETIAIWLVVVAITYFSLVLGELVPKRIALAQPERIARQIAPVMHWLTWFVGPLVRLLAKSTEIVLRMLRQRSEEPDPTSEEEIRYLIAEGAKVGVFAGTEQELVERVFQFADHRVGELMVPRSEVVAINIDMSPQDIRALVAASNNSRFPVYRENLDHVLGIVHAKDVLLQENHIDLQSILREPPYVPESQLISTTLRFFQTTHNHMAIVLNEYGGTEGLITLEDVLEELVGEIEDEHDFTEQSVVQRADGSLLVDGLLPIDELKELLGVETLPCEDEYQFNTLAGFVIAQLGRLPRVGDRVTAIGQVFEIVDMDGRRVDRLLITGPPAPSETVPHPE